MKIPNAEQLLPVTLYETERLEMTDTIKLLDIVALTVDLPEDKLRHGQVGTVVETLAGNKAFEVEFCDREGRTYESVGLRSDQIMVLHYDPVETNSKSA